MAKTDKNILNIGKLYDILSQIKTKISQRFTAVDTAISGKKASGASSVTNSDTIKTLKKLVLDANGNIVTTGNDKTEFQTIASATDPAGQSSHVSNTQGLVKLQDIINDDEDNTTNAVTPHAVSEAIKNFSSFVDITWILEACDDYDGEIHTFIADIRGTGAEDFDKYMAAITAMNSNALLLGVNEAGTWVGSGYCGFSPTYPGATWVPFGLALTTDDEATKYKLTFHSVNAGGSVINIGYQYSIIQDNTVVDWSDIENKPSIPAITHYPYQDSEHDTEHLRFVGDSYNGTKVYCRNSEVNSGNDVLMGVIPPEATHSGGLALMTNSLGKYVWTSPLPSYNSNTDVDKVLTVAAHAQGNNDVYPDWRTPKSWWGVNTDTNVQFIAQPHGEPVTGDPAMKITGIMNYRNNIVNITVPGDANVPFCDNNRIRIIAPSGNAYEYNFWIRLSITRASSYGGQRTGFAIEFDKVGPEYDQYRLIETDTTHTLSTKRMKIIDSASGYTYTTPYRIAEQQVGPSASPTTSTMNNYSTVFPVVLDYEEHFTASTGEAVFNSTLHTFTYGLDRDFSGSVKSVNVYVPSYGYTNYYLIKVCGDSFKLTQFEPPAT